jgi:hypothetical protein
MKDQYQTAPPGSLDALTEAANNLPPSHSSVAEILKHVHDFPQEHNPHAMNVAGLKDMASSGGLSKAIIIGWRYLSVSGGERKFAVEVHHDPDGSNHRFAGLSHGPAVEALITLIEDDRIRHQIESGAFTLATLSIPALDISALWLRAASGGDDMLIVVPPAPPFLKPWPDTYTVQQFENAVRDEAASNVKIHATVFA